MAHGEGDAEARAGGAEEDPSGWVVLVTVRRLIGLTFADEVRAAGLAGLAFSWGDDGVIEARDVLGWLVRLTKQSDGTVREWCSDGAVDLQACMSDEQITTARACRHDERSISHTGPRYALDDNIP